MKNPAPAYKKQKVRAQKYVSGAADVKDQVLIQASTLTDFSYLVDQ